jgi:hypothetical protein
MAELDKEKSEALYYARGATVFRRPVRTAKGVTMGFAVCDVRDGVDAIDLAEIMNLGEPAEHG